MKNLIIIFAFLSVIATADGQLQPDKKKHLLVGTEIGFAASAMTVNQKTTTSLAWSLGLSAGIGGAKELVYDKWMHKGTPEWADFGYTVLGGAVGFGIVQGFKGICTLIDKRQYRRLHPIQK